MRERGGEERERKRDKGENENMEAKIKQGLYACIYIDTDIEIYNRIE